MAVMFGNLYDALRSAGADEVKARGAAEEMAASLASMDVVNDVRSDIAELRTEVRADIAELRTEVRAEIKDLKAETARLKTSNAVLTWMGGFSLAQGTAVLFLLLRGLH